MNRSINRDRVESLIDSYGQAKLARELGISRVAVHCWTRRDYRVPVARVPMVAKLLGVGMYDLRPDIFPVGC